MGGGERAAGMHAALVFCNGRDIQRKFAKMGEEQICSGKNFAEQDILLRGARFLLREQDFDPEQNFEVR